MVILTYSYQNIDENIDILISVNVKNILIKRNKFLCGYPFYLMSKISKRFDITLIRLQVIKGS